MLSGMALYIHLLVYAGLSLFIINGLYVFMVVCVVYAYNLTVHARGACKGAHARVHTRVACKGVLQCNWVRSQHWTGSLYSGCSQGVDWPMQLFRQLSVLGLWCRARGTST